VVVQSSSGICSFSSDSSRRKVVGWRVARGSVNEAASKVVLGCETGPSVPGIGITGSRGPVCVALPRRWATSQALRRALTRRLRLTQSRDAFDATSSTSYRMPGPPNLTRAIKADKVKLARKWAALICNFRRDVTAYVEEAYFEAVTAEDQEIATLKEHLDRTSIQKATYLAVQGFGYPSLENVVI